MKVKIYADEMWPVYKLINTRDEEWDECDGYTNEVEIPLPLVTRYLRTYGAFTKAQDELKEFLKDTRQ